MWLFLLFTFVCVSLFAKGWDEMAKEVDTWVDGIGKRIDEGIKETVIGLNALGVTTRQSCEGHLDWGHPYPWVDFVFELPETEALTAKLEALLEVTEYDFDQWHAEAWPIHAIALFISK